MSVTAYLPSEITFDGKPLADVQVVTIFSPESPAPTGGLTMAKPPAAGSRGALVFTGKLRRDTWRVTLPDVIITNRTGAGCEFTAEAPPSGGPAVVRECLHRDETPDPKRQRGQEENIAIR